MRHLPQNIIDKATVLRNEMELSDSRAEFLREESYTQKKKATGLKTQIQELTGGCDCFSLRIMCQGHKAKKKQ